MCHSMINYLFKCLKGNSLKPMEALQCEKKEAECSELVSHCEQIPQELNLVHTSCDTKGLLQGQVWVFFTIGERFIMGW